MAWEVVSTLSGPARGLDAPVEPARLRPPRSSRGRGHSKGSLRDALELLDLDDDSSVGTASRASFAEVRAARARATARPRPRPRTSAVARDA